MADHHPVGHDSARALLPGAAGARQRRDRTASTPRDGGHDRDERNGGKGRPRQGRPCAGRRMPGRRFARGSRGIRSGELRGDQPHSPALQFHRGASFTGWRHGQRQQPGGFRCRTARAAQRCDSDSGAVGCGRGNPASSQPWRPGAAHRNGLACRQPVEHRHHGHGRPDGYRRERQPGTGGLRLGWGRDRGRQRLLVCPDADHRFRRVPAARLHRRCRGPHRGSQHRPHHPRPGGRRRHQPGVRRGRQHRSRISERLHRAAQSRALRRQRCGLVGAGTRRRGVRRGRPPC